MSLRGEVSRWGQLLQEHTLTDNGDRWTRSGWRARGVEKLAAEDAEQADALANKLVREIHARKGDTFEGEEGGTASAEGGTSGDSDTGTGGASQACQADKDCGANQVCFGQVCVNTGN